MPFSTEAVTPAGAVLIDTEASLKETILPELEAAGANISLVHGYDPTQQPRPFSLPQDIGLIEEATQQVRAKLVVLGPLSEILGVSLNSDQAARGALHPLVRLAERHGLAVLILRHLNKAGAGIGSVGIAALARSVLAAQSGRSGFVLQTHTNLAAPLPPVAYRVVGLQGDRKGIEWLDAPPNVERPPSHRTLEIEKAKEFVVAQLFDGPLPPEELKSRAIAAEVSPRTLRRAKEELQVVPAAQVPAEVGNVPCPTPLVQVGSATRAWWRPFSSG
jgi:hypothetical protein